MRCYICNQVIPEPQFSELYGSYDPCLFCLEVIEDAVGKKDRTTLPEDAFDDGDPLAGLTEASGGYYDPD